MAASSHFVFLGAMGISVAMQLAGFVVAFAFQTEKFFDLVGGVNYLALALSSWLNAQISYPGGAKALNDMRKIAITTVFCWSRLWLLLFLVWRGRKRDGDARLVEIKTKFGAFLFLWALQAVWVVCVSAPMLLVNAQSDERIAESAWTPADYTFAALQVFGAVLEAWADVVKARWVRAGRPGGFCTRCPWNVSRHPNYFGEILQWWMAWGFAFACSGGVRDGLWWACVVSPLLTMVIVLAVSGVPLANGKSLRRYYEHSERSVREGYTNYRKSTSILIPMFGYKYVPRFLKRTVFFDFACYEYTPSSESAEELLRVVLASTGPPCSSAQRHELQTVGYS